MRVCSGLAYALISTRIASYRRPVLPFGFSEVVNITLCILNSNVANQAWQIASAGKLVLNDLGPLPNPGPKEILVRIHAISLNYRDILVSDHDPAYPLKAKEDLIPGSDAAGVVEAHGSESHWKQGDRVVLHPNDWMFGDPRNYIFHQTLGGASQDGTFRRYMLVNEDRAFKAPDSMTLQEAATIFTAGVTAWRVLHYGEPKLLGSESTILTQGTGGVSCYAIQIAAAAGATVISTSSSDEKLEIARKLGATHTINYRKTPDWSSKVLELTGGVGVDIVVEVVGGAGLIDSINSVRYDGRVGLIGLLDKEDGAVAITRPLLFGGKTIQAHLGAGSRQMGIELSEFIDKHQIRPPIAKVFKFEEAVEAIDALRSFSGVGKIVIEV